DGFFHNNIFWPAYHTKRMVELYRQRFAHYGHGRPEDAIVGLGGQFYMAKDSQQAVREFRPYFDEAPVYGHGPSLEEFTQETPLTVGSPQQVVDRTLGFRDVVGDYQRQLFLVDHAGLPLKTVLNQLDLFGAEVLPVLKREFAAMAKPGTPKAPVHPRYARMIPDDDASRSADFDEPGAVAANNKAAVDDVTGASFYDQAPTEEAAVAHADELLKEIRSK
ncbi:MAG: LLM class flavin-dependent oxidoreductase, partial [Ancrocorticia sp.]|nr:LLM class flavin-dependent oxidoreductase [Ancrocorticia sp.]